MNWTRDELIAVGIPAKNLSQDLPEAGTVTYGFRDGRFRVIIPGGRVVGRGTHR